MVSQGTLYVCNYRTERLCQDCPISDDAVNQIAQPHCQIHVESLNHGLVRDTDVVDH